MQSEAQEGQGMSEILSEYESDSKFWLCTIEHVVRAQDVYDEL